MRWSVVRLQRATESEVEAPARLADRLRLAGACLVLERSGLKEIRDVHEEAKAFIDLVARCDVDRGVRLSETPGLRGAFIPCGKTLGLVLREDARREIFAGVGDTRIDHLRHEAG